MGKGAFKISRVRGSSSGGTNRGRGKYRVGTKEQARPSPAKQKVNLGVESPEPKPPKKEIEE